MNHLLIGTADKTEQLLTWADTHFLLIDDGPIADAFVEHVPEAKLFDIGSHSFNPLASIDYRRARDFATAVYTASPEGKETLTVRNGKRALVRLLLEGKRLDKLPRRGGDDPGVAEALNTIDDILLSPVVRSVLCKPTNFRFQGSVVARLDRAVLGDFDAFLLASLLVGQTRERVILPDFGFYGRDFQASLIRQNRLVAGLNFLDELPPKLRNAVLLIKDKVGRGSVPQDAETLAQFAGLQPGTNEHSDFVQQAIA